MNHDILAKTIERQLDRRQIKDLLEELTGERSRLAKPEAAWLLAETIAALPGRRRREALRTVQTQFGDWTSARHDTGVHLMRDAHEQGLQNWLEVGQDRVRGHKGVARPSTRAGSAQTRFVSGDEHAGALVQLIKGAICEVELVAYVFGHHDVCDALCEAATRGVNVRLWLDGRETKYGKGRQNSDKARELSGVIKVEYRKIHGKCAVIDRRSVLLGSSNLGLGRADVYEANVKLEDPALARQLIESLEQASHCD